MVPAICTSGRSSRASLMARPAVVRCSSGMAARASSSRARSATFSSFSPGMSLTVLPSARNTPGSSLVFRHGCKGRHQGGNPRRRPGYQVPARDQGDAQGDASRRRQAGYPVRRGGSRRGRPRRRPDDHRPQQGLHRESLRPGLRARGGAGRQGRRRAAGPGARVQRAGHRALRAPGRAEGPRPRRALRGPARRPRAVRGAARRRPHRQPRPAARADDRGARAARRQRGRADGGRPGAGLPVRLRRDHADRRGGRGHGDRSGGEAGARLGAEQLDPDRALRLRSGRVRRAARDPARARRRDPAHRRAADAGQARSGGRRRRARRAVPRPPLRHRQQAGLPAHPGPVRLRALRPGRGDRALAAQVPGQPPVTHGHGHRHSDGPLTPVEEHLAEILATVTPLAPAELSLGDVHGLVLAEDVSTVSPLPSFDNSGMDGYAVRVEDVAAATEENPVTLPVTAEIAAGDTGAYALQPGTAIKIMTGAMLPPGAEAVVPVEWTDGGSARVTIKTGTDYGNAVRLAGEDAKAGEVLVTAGTLLKPMHIAVIAAAGRGAVLVRPRPRVVVLSTGNELAEPGSPLVPGRIYDSNSFMLAAAAREAGCLAYRRVALPDHPDEVLPAIEDQLVRADLMITTGGVSMGGEHDVVKAALQRLGTITFRKVAMQPGMPQGFGTIALPAAAAPVSAPGERVPIFTFPGNPVSAYVSFQLFARPAIGALQGYDGLGLEKIQATLTGPLRSPAGRRSFLRGVLDRASGTVEPLTGQGSHQIATLGKANALVVVPERVVQMAEGDTAEVLVLP